MGTTQGKDLNFSMERWSENIAGNTRANKKILLNTII